MAFSKSNSATIALLDQYFTTAFNTPSAIPKLQDLILSLAMQGKLVPQNPDDKPAHDLLKNIEAEKQQLIKAGKIKKSKPLPDITPDEIPYDIPDSWEWVRLGNLAVFFFGKTPGSKNPIYWSDLEGINWASIGDLPSRGFLNFTQKKVTQKAIDDVFKSEPVPIGTLLMSFKLSIGKTAITKIPVYHNEAIISFPYLINELKMYLYWCLDIISKTGDHKTAIKGNTLNSTSLNNLLIPLPPLEEQKRIVKKIDELMEKCALLRNLQEEREAKRLKMQLAVGEKLLKAPSTADFNEAWGFMRDNFETIYSVKENVKQLRQTILQLAVMGKLVPQHSNDKPARELLKDIEAEKQRLIEAGKIKKSKPLPTVTGAEIPYDIPDSWEWVRLGDIFQLKSGYSFSKQHEVVTGNFMYLKVGEMNLVENEVYIKTTSIYLNESEKVLNSLIPANSIVFPKRGGAIATNKKRLVNQPICVDTNIMSMICPIQINLQFAYYWISSVDLATLNSGTSVPQINNKDINPLLFPLPPLEEQKRIVEKVDKMMKLCDELEEKITAQTDTQTRLLDAVIAQI